MADRSGIFEVYPRPDNVVRNGAGVRKRSTDKSNWPAQRIVRLNEKIFRPDRQILGQSSFHTGTDRPPDIGLRGTKNVAEPRDVYIVGKTDECHASSPVEQHAVDCKTCSAPHRADPLQF